MWEIKSPIYKKKTYTTSLIFFIVVVVFTLSIYFFNSYIEGKVENIKSEINSIEKSISEVEQNEKLQVYSLLEINKELISSYNKMNNITKYINHMNVIWWKYDLNLLGFNLSEGEIITNINVLSDNKWIAYEKTRDFIKNYRNDEKALFNLWFINSVEWMDDMSFKVTLKIK